MQKCQMNSFRAQKGDFKAVGTRLVLGRPSENRRRGEVCCSSRMSFVLLCDYQSAEYAVLIPIILGHL